MGEPVTVVTPSGRTISVDADSAQNLVQQGGRMQSGPEGDAAAQQQAEAARFDNPLAAAGLGVARGLTLGGSDALANAAGMGFEVGKYKEHNPVSSVVGEVGGSISGAGLAGAATRAAKAAGAAVIGEGVATSAARKVAAATVEGAVDGGLFNAGQAVSSAALADEPLTIDSVASSVGMGALFGGGIGGGLGAVASLSGAIRKKLAAKANPLLNARSQGTKELGGHIGASLKELDDGVPDALQQLRNKRAGQIVKERDEAVGGFAVPANPTDDAAHVPSAGQVVPENQGATAVGRKRPVVDAAETRVGKGKDTFVDALPEGAAAGAIAKEEKLAAKAAQADQKAAARAGTQIDNAPLGAQPQSKWPTPLPNESGVAYALRAADRELADLRVAYSASRRKMVERFGEDFSIDLGALARKPPAQALKSVQAIDDYAKAASAIREATGELLDPQKMLVSRIEMKATPEVGKAFNGLGSMDRAALADVLKVDVSKIPAYGPAAEHVLKAYGLARFAEGATAKAAVNSAEGRVAEALKGLKQDAVMGGIGFALGGLPGAGAAAALRVIGRPGAALMRMATRSGEVAAKITEGVDRFVQATAGSTARRAYTRTGAAVLNQVRFSDREGTAEAPALKRIQELQDTLANPARLEAYVDDQLAPLRAHNMDLGYAVADQVKARLSFLASKMPQVPPPDPFSGWQPEPSEADVSDWARYIEASENPLSILDELEHGDLCPETVETVKELYPGLFEAVRQRIVEQALEKKVPIEYQDRLNLTLLFDVPVEATAAPENVQALQDMYALLEQEQQDQLSGPSRGGSPKPPAMTPGQQFAQ